MAPARPELLFQYTPGAGMVLTDWSPDGKFVTFYTGVIVLVPVGTPGDAKSRKEIDWLREDYEAGQGRFSPDNRYIAYLSNEDNVDRGEVYVRPFDPGKPDAPLTGKGVRISKDGAIGMITVAAGRQRAVLHEPRLGSDGRGYQHDTDVHGGRAAVALQTAGAACRAIRCSGRTSARTASDSSSRCRPPGVRERRHVEGVR
jgi:hypothetical protein